MIFIKKTIKVKICDCGKNFDIKGFYLYQFLEKKYNVILSDKPDYIISSIFGVEHSKYNGIKIFYTGENLRPDFNLYDYCIGFDYIEFEDRYIRIPIYLLEDKYLSIFKYAQVKHLEKSNYKIRKKFCNMVCSNGSDQIRNELFKKLCSYKKIDSGGKYMNNIGSPVKDKLEFQKQYKFSIAFENSRDNGYTTEKLIDAFASGGIPIYYGDPLVGKIFNKKAFIDLNDFKTINEAIEYIKKIDNDDKLYLEYIKEPMLLDEKYLEKEFKRIDLFLTNIFDKDIKNAKRVSNSAFTIVYNKNNRILEKYIGLKNIMYDVITKINHNFKK